MAACAADDGFGAESRRGVAEIGLDEQMKTDSGRVQP
jgi:hypothetical protein